ADLNAERRIFVLVKRAGPPALPRAPIPSTTRWRSHQVGRDPDQINLVADLGPLDSVADRHDFHAHFSIHPLMIVLRSKTPSFGPDSFGPRTLAITDCPTTASNFVLSRSKTPRSLEF